MEQVVKPIFVIKLPRHFNQHDFNHVAKNCENKMKDYHVLCVMNSAPDVEFECFYNKDIKEVEIEALKQVIQNSLNSLYNKQN